MLRDLEVVTARLLVGSFDLRTFPPGQFERFATSVIKGKNNMPAGQNDLSESAADLQTIMFVGKKP
jgi:hypothetical protein